SECGESGWVALHDPSSDTKIGARGVHGIQLANDPTRIYRGWFGYRGARNPHIVVISPWPEEELLAIESKDVQWNGQQSPVLSGDVEQEKRLASREEPAQQIELEYWYLCPKSLVLRRGDGPCPLTNDPKRFRVRINDETRQDEKRGVIGYQGC